MQNKISAAWKKRWHHLLTWLNGRWRESKTDSWNKSKTPGVVQLRFLFKTQRVIHRFSHFLCFKYVWIRCRNNQNPSLVDVRLKMGLEPALLPQGISHWSAGSGTSCSLCHQDIVLRNKWFVHRRSRKHVVPPTDESMCWTWATSSLLSTAEAPLTFCALCYAFSTCWSRPPHPTPLCSVAMETLNEEWGHGENWDSTDTCHCYPATSFVLRSGRKHFGHLKHSLSSFATLCQCFNELLREGSLIHV